MEGTEPRFKRPTWWWYTRIGLGLVFAVFLLWLVLGFWWYSTFPSNGEPGTFGDSFGMVNALFSGLAFAGVVLAIIIQIVELRVTWEEIEDSRKAQQQSAQQQYFAALVSSLTSLNELTQRRRIDFDTLRETPTHWYGLISEYHTRSLLRMVTDGMLVRSPDQEPRPFEFDESEVQKVDERCQLATKLVEYEHLVVGALGQIQRANETIGFEAKIAAHAMKTIDDQAKFLASELHDVYEGIHKLVQQDAVSRMKDFMKWPNSDRYKQAVIRREGSLIQDRVRELRKDLDTYICTLIDCYPYSSTADEIRRQQIMSGTKG